MVTPAIAIDAAWATLGLPGKMPTASMAENITPRKFREANRRHKLPMTEFSISHLPDIAAAILPHPSIFATMLTRKCMGVEDLLQGFPQSVGRMGCAHIFWHRAANPEEPLESISTRRVPQRSLSRARRGGSASHPCPPSGCGPANCEGANYSDQ